MNYGTNRSSAPVADGLQKKSGMATVVCFLGLAMLTGIFACKNNNQPSQVAANHADTTLAVRDTLQAQVNAARVQVDQLTTHGALLDSQIHLKDAEIAKLEKERGDLSRKNRALAGKLKKDDKKLAALKKEMNDKDKEYAARLGILQSDKDNLTQQLGDLMHKYNDLKALGSVLHASNISVEALHLKKHGRKEKLTHRARKLNILRIHFDIDENRIAEDGNKTLYLVIDGPDGKLMNNNGSGELTTAKGSTIGYSFQKQVYLKQDEPVKDVTADWPQDGEHEKGSYTIAIYNGGYKIGSGSVYLD